MKHKIVAKIAIAIEILYEKTLLFMVSRNVAQKPRYYVEPREKNPYVGDYLGQPAPTRWRVVGRKCGYGGGPYQWHHQYYR